MLLYSTNDQSNGHVALSCATRDGIPNGERGAILLPIETGYDGGELLPWGKRQLQGSPVAAARFLHRPCSTFRDEESCPYIQVRLLQSYEVKYLTFA